METFVDKLRRDYAHLTFKETGLASWSSHTGQVSYAADENEVSIWAVLHELGHALLDHQSYSNDIDLLQKETAAWEKAGEIGKKYGVRINQDHVQSCLDTYRDWLHKRSACPSCGSHGLQRSKSLYGCLNCRGTWKVTSERFCRPYRLKNAQKTN